MAVFQVTYRAIIPPTENMGNSNGAKVGKETATRSQTNPAINPITTGITVLRG
jgi:hypothetical protein